MGEKKSCSTVHIWEERILLLIGSVPTARYINVPSKRCQAVVPGASASRLSFFQLSPFLSQGKLSLSSLFRHFLLTSPLLLSTPNLNCFTIPVAIESPQAVATLVADRTPTTALLLTIEREEHDGVQPTPERCRLVLRAG